VTGFWSERRVLVTGHTGFKGSWLTMWLRELGATVFGYALAPPTTPSLFDAAHLGEGLEWLEADVRDATRVREAVVRFAPEIVFHLAAQPLVRASYEQPSETFETNVMGTVNVLEAARRQATVRALVIVTSDKCYENAETARAVREEDALGGRDPYSASKACAELVAGAYARALFGEGGPAVATARAGNVIGGGDWARDRLIPDLVRALGAREPALIRNPASTRPWQHVLEPLAGYLRLAERLHGDRTVAAGAWNFGPDPSAVRPVGQVADEICRRWGAGARWTHDDSAQPREARVLALDSSKARAHLDWRPCLTHDETLAWTVEWYQEVAGGGDARALTLAQLRRYQETAA
jgi:CDP-glucose 4,6-dehydratase